MSTHILFYVQQPDKNACITPYANMRSMYALLKMQVCMHVCIGNVEVGVQR
jgi:hypothetical protein